MTLDPFRSLFATFIYRAIAPGVPGACRPRTAILALLAALLLPSVARGDLELRWSGQVQSDIRYRVESKGVGEYYGRLELPQGFSRNENFVKLRLDASYDRFSGVAEVDFVLLGLMEQPEGLSSLSKRDEVDPYYLQAHALYLEGFNILVDGLDLRVGQQVVSWGKGDQFNPTNTLNSLDLEDPLLFGELLANIMVKLDYSFMDVWSISAVLVPIFKPALLPASGALATASADRLPFVDDSLRWRLHAEKALSGLLYPTVVKKATPVLPETEAENMQFALRLAGVVSDQDIAFSYYYGRSGLPQPYLNVSGVNPARVCNPVDATQCQNGLIETEVYLQYPRMQVLGLNMSGQIPMEWLWDKLTSLGYRLELGVFFPQESSLALLQTTQILTQPAGEYPYGKQARPDGRQPLVVTDTPFAKWAVGLDYTVAVNWTKDTKIPIYINVQWVHGFPDEFGAGDFFSEGSTVRRGGVSRGSNLAKCVLEQDGRKCAEEILMPRIADYLVLGVDFKFLSDRMLLRLFTIWALNGVVVETWDENAEARVQQHHSMFTEEGFSAILYPELNFNLGGGFELGAGALIMLGEDYSKFGDPATGGTQVWTRARFSY